MTKQNLKSKKFLFPALEKLLSDAVLLRLCAIPNLPTVGQPSVDAHGRDRSGQEGRNYFSSTSTIGRKEGKYERENSIEYWMPGQLGIGDSAGESIYWESGSGSSRVSIERPRPRDI